MRCKILLPEFKLQVIDSIITTEKGIQSSVHKSFKYLNHTFCK